MSTDAENYSSKGGNILVGTPGRIEDLLLGKSTGGHRKSALVLAVSRIRCISYNFWPPESESVMICTDPDTSSHLHKKYEVDILIITLI